MRSVALTCLILSVTVVFPVRAAETERTDQDLFTSQVRPILARHCFKCHGPDDKARKAKLRLDLRTESVKPAESGAIPIVPGKPEESECVSRIFADDASERMPPAATKNPLSESDKQVLKRWIADGAEYKTHWAFLPPRSVHPPQIRRASWAQNAIDRLILARLEANNLTPSETADRDLDQASVARLDRLAPHAR